MQKEKSKELRICKKCKTEKPVSNFGVRNANSDGLMVVCKECNRLSQKIQYSNNKTYYLDRNREHRSRNRELYRQSKEGKPCARCGGVFPQVVMDYDHLDPKTKRMCVAQMLGYSWADIQSEINKCELLCSNCHRIKTYETSNRQKQHRITTCHKRSKCK